MATKLNIRQTRLAANLSQRDLAQRLGISSAAVAKWEAGQSYPSADKLPALANALGVPIDQLYSRDSPPRWRAEGESGVKEVNQHEKSSRVL